MAVDRRTLLTLRAINNASEAQALAEKAWNLLTVFHCDKPDFYPEAVETFRNEYEALCRANDQLHADIVDAAVGVKPEDRQP